MSEASALRPFKYTAFTVIWTATVISNIGGWMQSAAAGWLTSRLNADPRMVSLVQVAAILPMFLLGLPAQLARVQQKSAGDKCTHRSWNYRECTRAPFVRRGTSNNHGLPRMRSGGDVVDSCSGHLERLGTVSASWMGTRPRPRGLRNDHVRSNDSRKLALGTSRIVGETPGSWRRTRRRALDRSRDRARAEQWLASGHIDVLTRSVMNHRRS